MRSWHRPAWRRRPRRTRSPNDGLKSVEIAPDRKVTFRIFAPKASEVSVGGDFGQGGKLTKDEQGVWSITVGPLAADYYTYDFSVDGVKTVDPKNPMVKPGIGSVDSMFLVPGGEAEFEIAKDVPHGDVRERCTAPARSTNCAGCTFTRLRAMTPVATAIPFSTCCMARVMTIRAGAPSAGQGSSLTT